jgi:hypothetical protein
MALSKLSLVKVAIRVAESGSMNRLNFSSDVFYHALGGEDDFDGILSAAAQVPNNLKDIPACFQPIAATAHRRFCVLHLLG